MKLYELSERNCTRCGKPFMGYGTAKYCPTVCAWEVYRQRQKKPKKGTHEQKIRASANQRGLTVRHSKGVFTLRKRYGEMIRAYQSLDDLERGIEQYNALTLRMMAASR